jgi:GntR family transcriptional regulator
MTERALDRQSHIPLWRQLSDWLRDQIAAGAFPQRLPTEHELMSSFGVSRHTVREALRGLHSSGLLERQRGLGTFVATSAIEQPLNVFYSFAHSAAVHGRTERSDVLRKATVTNARVAAALQQSPTERLTFIERLRYIDDEPLGLVRSWVPFGLLPNVTREELERGSVYDVLSSRGLRVTDGWERIRAESSTDRQRRLLRISRGTAVLTVTRLALVGEVPVEWRETVLRGDRYTFTARLLGDPTERPIPLRYVI